MIAIILYKGPLRSLSIHFRFAELLRKGLQKRRCVDFVERPNAAFEQSLSFCSITTYTLCRNDAVWYTKYHGIDSVTVNVAVQQSVQCCILVDILWILIETVAASRWASCGQHWLSVGSTLDHWLLLLGAGKVGKVVELESSYEKKRKKIWE